MTDLKTFEKGKKNCRVKVDVGCFELLSRYKLKLKLT